MPAPEIIYRSLQLPIRQHGHPAISLRAELARPTDARALVIVCILERNLSSMPPSGLQEELLRKNFAVLRLELLTATESLHSESSRNTILLAERLMAVFDYCRHDGDTQSLLAGLYAAGDCAPAAVRAAAQRDTYVFALAVRDGLIDHAGREYLEALTAPLLILEQQSASDLQASQERACRHLTAPWSIEKIGPAEEAAFLAHWLEEKRPA